MHITLSMGHGGLERIVNKLVKKTDKNIFDISVCCLDRGGPFLDDLSDQGIKKFVLSRKPGIFDIKLLARLVKIVLNEKIDVIHSHSGCSLYAAMAGNIGRVKGVIHTDHGRLVPDRRGLILEDRISSFFLNAYVSVSRELSEYLVNKVRVRSSRLLTIINGVDTDMFRPLPEDQIRSIRAEFGIPNDAELIGTVCRLNPVKNIPFLLHTMKDFLLNRKNARLLIVGDGPERELLQNMIDDLRLNDKVLLTGMRSDVEKILPILDIFVLPSISEGTSMTILEAMASGIPVIASKVGGNIRLVKEGTTGYLFPLDKPRILIDRTTDLLNNKELRKKMGIEAKSIVEQKMSFSLMLEQYIRLYSCLAAR